MIHRGTMFLLVLLLVSLPAGSPGEPTSDRRVIIVAADGEDARIEYTREALTFWNQTLEGLGLHSRLREVEVMVAPTGLNGFLEIFARVFSLRAGLYGRRERIPPFPPNLPALGAHSVFLLPRHPLMSSPGPLETPNRYFVVTRKNPESPDP